ncbi:MAG: PQQ-binding-like beta-propeller repeat protein [bacterium]
MLFSVVIFVSGCATTKDPGEIVIVSSHESRPDWTFTPSTAGDEHEYRYFVGVSEYQNSEKKARNEARGDVQGKIAEFLEGTLSGGRGVKISPKKLSGSYDVKDIYIQKVFQVEGYQWKVYVLAGFPKKLMNSKEKFIKKISEEPEPPAEDSKKQAFRIKWKNEYGPRAGAFALSPDEQTIYASSHYPQGDLYAFDRAGNVKWNKQLPGRYGGWPTVAPDGTLYYVKNTDAGDEWTVYAFSPEGKKLWEYADNCVFKRGVAIGPDGSLYIGSMKGRMGEKMYALSPAGKLKWKKQLGSQLVAAPVVGSNGTIYQTGYNKKANRSILYAFNPDGSIKWTYRAEGAYMRRISLTEEGNILASDLNGGVHAVSSSGKLLWFTSTEQRLRTAPVIGPEGTIFVAGVSNKLFALTPGGDKKWSRELPGDSDRYMVRSTPVVDEDGYIYVTNYRSREAGFLAAITPQGDLDWKLELDGGAHQSGNLLLTGDGIILATTHNGRLYAIKTDTGKGLAESPWPAYQQNNQNTGRQESSVKKAKDEPGESKSAGTVKWKFGLPSTLPHPAALSPDGRTIYIRSGFRDGNLYAIDFDGNKKWRLKLDGFRNGSVPAVGNSGIIYVGGAESGKFYAVNPDGTIRWNTEVEGRIRGSPALDSEETIYISANKLYAINSNGEKRWSFSGQGPFTTAASLALDGTIYVGNKKFLWALNPDGSVKWNFKGRAEFWKGSPVVDTDGTVYAGDKSGSLYALDSSGELKWKFNSGAVLNQNISVGESGRIYVGNSAGEVFALDRKGNKCWEFRAENPELSVTSVPTLSSEGNIYVNMTGPNFDPRSKIFALDMRGKVKWSVTNDGRFKGDPAIGPTGTLYVGSGYRSSEPGLWAIDTSAGKLAESPWPAYQQNNQNTGRQDSFSEKEGNKQKENKSGWEWKWNF